MCFCGAADGVEGAAEGGVIDLEVHDSAGTVGPSVVKRFPFLTGCTALWLPDSISTETKKASLCSGRFRVLVCRSWNNSVAIAQSFTV